MLKKKSNRNFSNTENIHLSIRLSSDGFSFSIKDRFSKEVLAIGVYPFEQKKSLPIKQLQQFKDIFHSEPLLQQAYSHITVSHYNRLVTQVPLPFFDENCLKEYLNYTIKVLDNDYITFDKLQSIEMANVYIPFVNINNFLFDTYGSFVFKHSATVLIENLRKSCTEDSHYVYVNVHTDSMEVIVFKQKEFKLYNVFSYQTEEDFIYYILFVAEQLQLNPQEFLLQFLGNIDEDSAYYKLLKEYVTNVKIYQSTNNILIPFDEVMPHKHFTLLHQ